MRLERRIGRIGLALSASLVLVATSLAQRQSSTANTKSSGGMPSGQEEVQAEIRVVDYIRDHIEPGKPLVVTDLYNTVFTQPAEHQALDKLYRAFFRIPLFVAQYQEKFGHPPTLKTITEQFDLRAPGAADVLLRVMESDPRVPQFLTRDPATGAITKVDVAAIRTDQQFGAQLQHQLAGWEGKPAPPFVLAGINGDKIDSASLAGKVVLLYVWFTGCPPCIQESPVLVALEHRFSSKGLVIVGANADRILGLSYTDEARKRYLAEHKIEFPIGHWSAEANTAYGGISIFPTLFLVDSKGMVRGHWVGFASASELGGAVGKVISGS
ncbi:MAG TPA: TlpA disulfide reductase family protein [Terriglobia bacterium]|nr:TlpA disulfide reductase family protein [Terriglobia bacterium]